MLAGNALCYGKYFGVPEELAIQVATALGGMGGMGKTCGAVTGVFLVLGLTYEIDNPQKSRSEVYNLVKEFTKRFITRHGSISCADLLGYDMGTEEGMKIIREQKLTKSICPGIDQSVAELVEELLAGRLPKAPE